MIACLLLGLAIALPDAELEQAYEQISKTRRSGKFTEALAAFEKLANENTEHPLAQRALATAGQIAQWNLNDLDQAKALYDRVLLGPDDQRGVLPALIGRLLIEREQLGLKAELELAKRLEAKQPKAEQAPWLLLHCAKLLAEELNDPAIAVGYLERVRAEHASTTYVDDALFLEAKLLRALKRPREALIMYGAIIDSKRSSLVVGSYNSVYLDDAFYEAAETLRLELRDARLAEKAYLEVVDQTPDSVLVDDALHHANLLATARGDAKAASEYQARLRKLRPGSRYL